MRWFVVALAALSACQLVDPPSSLTSGLDGSPTNDGGADVVVPTTCDASTATDPANCNFCGHDCQGNACTDSVCQTTIAFHAFVADMALEGNVLYYVAPDPPVADAGGVYTYDTQSMKTSPLVAAPAAQAIAVHAPYVFWATTDGSIMRALEDGSATTTLATGQTIDCLAANGANVFWADQGTSTIYELPAAGAPGAPQVFRQGTCVAANDTYVVYEDAVSLKRFDIAANRTDPFTPSLGQPEQGRLSLGNDDAYFAAQDGQTHYVFHVGPTTPTTTPVTPVAQYLQPNNNLSFAALVGDGRGFYWSINEGQAPIYGCSEPTCASGQHQYGAADYPWIVAIDLAPNGAWGYAYQTGQGSVVRFAR